MDDLEIDRTLHTALSVEPSPEFVVRVRTAIAEAPRPSIAVGWLKPAAVVACAAVVVAAWLPRREARPKLSPTEITEIASRSIEAPATVVRSLVVPTLPAARTSKRPARVRSIALEPPFPDVIIAAGDVEALRQLLVSLNEHTFVASFDETPVSTPWVMTNLSIAPIGGDLVDSASAHNN